MRDVINQWDSCGRSSASATGSRQFHAYQTMNAVVVRKVADQQQTDGEKNEAGVPDGVERINCTHRLAWIAQGPDGDHELADRLRAAGALLGDEAVAAQSSVLRFRMTASFQPIVGGALDHAINPRRSIHD
jgi:hypothetical protein